MVGWHHPLNRHEFEQILGDVEGQGNLECCSDGVAKSRTRLINSNNTVKCRWLVRVYCIAQQEREKKKVHSVCRTYVKLTLKMYSIFH